MKSGLAAFNYKEVQELINLGVDITVFPTKYNEGPYMVPEGAGLERYNKPLIPPKQLGYFVTHPVLYSKLLKEATSTHTLLDMMIAWDFAFKAKKHGLNHIHCHHGDHKFFIGYYMKKILGLPLTVTIHSHSLWINPNEEFFRRALNYADGVVSISEYNKKVLNKKFGVSSDKVKVIRLFADPEMISKKPTKKILIVGQFAERKGHETLFKAVKELDEKVTIWVVGGGTWDKEGYVDVEQLAEQLEIRDQIVFFGKVSDEVLKELYEKCDLFCLPSQIGSDDNREGIPVTLMEAMAYGKPVISTKHAGIPELVPDDWLVEEGDWKALAGRIEDIQRIEVNQIKRKSKEIISNNYSSKNVKKLLAYFFEKR